MGDQLGKIAYNNTLRLEEALKRLASCLYQSSVGVLGEHQIKWVLDALVIEEKEDE